MNKKKKACFVTILAVYYLFMPFVFVNCAGADTPYAAADVRSPPTDNCATDQNLTAPCVSAALSAAGSGTATAEQTQKTLTTPSENNTGDQANTDPQEQVKEEDGAVPQDNEESKSGQVEEDKAPEQSSDVNL